MKNIVQSNFHITIAATVTGEQDVVQQVEHVLNATKVALLYADNVTLYSTAVNFINPLLTITHLNQKQKINLLELILPTMCVAQPEKASSYKRALLHESYMQRVSTRLVFRRRSCRAFPVRSFD